MLFSALLLFSPTKTYTLVAGKNISKGGDKIVSAPFPTVSTTTYFSKQHSYSIIFKKLMIVLYNYPQHTERQYHTAFQQPNQGFSTFPAAILS
jgi:hypothetical protein